MKKTRRVTRTTARARAKGQDREEGTAIEPSGRLRKKKVLEGQRRR
jgi:hypothetical protein